MPYIRILLLLALPAAFPPISTDMYLPALPRLQAAWGAELATVNLTLVLFFVCFSLALLASGSGLLMLGALHWIALRWEGALKAVQ